MFGSSQGAPLVSDGRGMPVGWRAKMHCLDKRPEVNLVARVVG